MSKFGDIWKLGPHRLMRADSLIKQNILDLIGSEKIDTIITDPPYNMQYGGGGCFKKSTRNIDARLKSLIDFKAENISFYTELGIPSIFIFTSKSLLLDYFTLFKGWNFNVLFWGKTNPVPFCSSGFLPDIEYLLHFAKPGRVWNKGLKPMNIYSKFYISPHEEGKWDAGGDLHPTIKPLRLIENKIRITSHPNGAVLDPFGGSGTTLIACELTGRRCFTLEYESEYCETIIKRWEVFTGGKAVLLN